MHEELTIHFHQNILEMWNAKYEMFFPSQLTADLSLYLIARPCSLFVYLQTLIVGHKPAAKSYFLAVNMAVVINIHNLFHQMPFANAHRERCPPREWIQPWIAISRLSLRCWEKRPDWDILSLPSSVSLSSSCSHTHMLKLRHSGSISSQWIWNFHTLNAYLT